MPCRRWNSNSRPEFFAICATAATVCALCVANCGYSSRPSSNTSFAQAR